MFVLRAIVRARRLTVFGSSASTHPYSGFGPAEHWRRSGSFGALI